MAQGLGLHREESGISKRKGMSMTHKEKLALIVERERKAHPEKRIYTVEEWHKKRAEEKSTAQTGQSESTASMKSNTTSSSGRSLE